MRFQGGNFFEDPLPKVDVIVMGHIHHDWDLAQKKVLLGKVFDLIDADNLELTERDGLNAGFELYEGVVLTVGSAVDD